MERSLSDYMISIPEVVDASNSEHVSPSSLYADIYTAQLKSDGSPVYVYHIQPSGKDKTASDVFIDALGSYFMLTQKQHPIIQKFYGYSLNNEMYRDELKFFFVAEACPHTLYWHLENNNSDFNNTSKSIFAYLLAAGLLHMHTCNVTHRCLSPLTIEVDENLYPRITNFFQSRDNKVIMDSTNILNDVPIFEAPEISCGSHFNFLVDVFSYGMILQSLATDSFPILEEEKVKDLTEAEIKFRIRNNDRPKLNDSPGFENLNKLITMCWAPNPEDRPTFIDIIIYLNSVKSLFPNTDMDRYNSVIEPIFAKTRIPENQTIRFQKRFQDQFQELQQLYNSNQATPEEIGLLALCYEHGLGCMKIQKAAYDLLEESSKKGDLESTYKLGLYYYESIPTDQCNLIPRSYSFLYEACQKQYVPAYYVFAKLLSEKYEYIPMEKNEALNLSLKYFRESLQHPDIFSELFFSVQGFYGNLLIQLAKIAKQENNIQLHDDYLTEAQILYEKLIDSHPIVAKDLAEIYLLQDHNQIQKAIDLLNKIPEEKRFGDWYLSYGIFEERGYTNPENAPNYLEALINYELAITHGSIHARTKAAQIYETMDKLYQLDQKTPLAKYPDLERAAFLYEEAANMEDSLAQFKFGYMLYNGKGVEKSLKGAISYFERLALRPSVPYPEAMLTLAEIYMNHHSSCNFLKDQNKAKKYLEMVINMPKAKESQNQDFVKRAKELMNEIRQDELQVETDIRRRLDAKK